MKGRRVWNVASLSHAFVFLLGAVGCAAPALIEPSLSILSPLEGARYEAGVPVVARASGGGAACGWVDSAGTILGQGEMILLRLPDGETRIGLQHDGVSQDWVTVTIDPPVRIAGGVRRLPLTEAVSRMELAAGTYAPAVVVWGEAVNPTLTPVAVTVAGRSVRLPLSIEDRVEAIKEDGSILRDTRLLFVPPPRRTGRSLEDHGGNEPLAATQPGARARFRMADVGKGTAVPGFEVDAVLVAAVAGYELWLDESSSPDPTALDEIRDAAFARVLPRVEALWGKPDARGLASTTLAILVSGRLADSRLAVGFFNPADFYRYDANSASDTYNPTSNERMIVYCSTPATDPADEAYFRDAVIATIGHEYQHLIAHSRTTYAEWRMGADKPFEEESWLSEAEAHLTESLVGYGESGGNYRFVQRYADAPWRYSLGSFDSDGATDSVGKRGGSAALLYHLLESAGGARSTGDAAFEGGGVPFLRSLLDIRDAGWAKLARLAGAEPREILEAWAASVALAAGDQSAILDTVTGQRLDISLEARGLRGAGATYDIGGPTLVDLSAGEIQLAPLSIAWGTALKLDARSLVSLSAPGSAGMAVFLVAAPPPP